MSQIFKTSTGGGGGGGITTINGDTGSITGSTVTIHAETFLQTSGSSVSFNNSGTVSLLNLSDSLDNTIIGISSGNSGISGFGNQGYGNSTLRSLTSGTNNIAIGTDALFNSLTSSFNCGVGFTSLSSLTDGSYNTAIGYHAGNGYSFAESSNIIIANSGSGGESNVTRIGTQGSGNAQQNRCFIAGITGITNSNPAVVTLNTSTGQLGDDTTNFTILPTGLQLKGNNDVTTPPVGFIGEQIRSAVASGSAISLTTNTGANLASITLDAGIYDGSALVNFISAATTVTTHFSISISATSATLGPNPGDDGAVFTLSGATIAGLGPTLTVPAFRIELSSTTTYYLVVQGTFTTNALLAYGRISATRVG